MIGQCVITPEESPRKGAAPRPSPPRATEIEVTTQVAGEVSFLVVANGAVLGLSRCVRGRDALRATCALELGLTLPMCRGLEGAVELAVIKTCAHQVVWNNMCSACGAEVDQNAR